MAKKPGNMLGIQVKYTVYINKIDFKSNKKKLTKHSASGQIFQIQFFWNKTMLLNLSHNQMQVNNPFNLKCIWKLKWPSNSSTHAPLSLIRPNSRVQWSKGFSRSKIIQTTIFPPFSWKGAYPFFCSVFFSISRTKTAYWA